MKTKISLKQMVENFIVEHKKVSVNYLNDLQRKGTHMNHQERIKLALTSYPEHKWQIQAYGTEEAFREAALQLFAKETQIKNSKTFDQLLMCINQVNIKGFGDLAKYDAAITFGCIMGKFPDKIFMHAGPEKAARFIFGNKYVESLRYLKQPGRILPYIDVKEFSQEFDALKATPYLIEDCLCYIYNTYLK